MTAKAEQPTADDVRRLAEMETQFVSLVPRGANRQSKFFIVKADGSTVPPVAIEPEQPAAAPEPEEKAVPAADASPEDKRAAQDERASKYGIEAREDGNLSYPADSPTTETLYGDPVNLMYPFGGTDNTVDVGRVRNALARFKQAASGYTNASSRVKVYERIVRAALAAGIQPSYDPNDAIDAALPSDLKERLQEKNEPDAPAATPGAPGQTEGDHALAAASKLDNLAPWLETAGARVQALVMDAVLTRSLEPSPSAPEAHIASAPVTPTDEPVAASSAEEIAALKQDLGSAVARIATLEAEVREQRAAAETARAAGAAEVAKAQSALAAERARVAKLRGSIARPSALPTGEVPAAASGTPARVCWAGDLAKQVREQEHPTND